MTHTPGPWERESSGRTQEIRASRTLIATLVDGTREDARLIAAAPELLEASRDALESLRRLPDAEGTYRVTCIKQLEQAIAKATNH